MLSEAFKGQVQARPDETYTVLITVDPDAPVSDISALQRPSVEPYPGLSGIYKATLTGHAILALEQETAIQAIEPDDLTAHTQ